MINDLRSTTFECPCKICRTVVRLIEDGGAQLQFSPRRAGRLCELAVVAAAGDQGILEGDVVLARREYAKHLGVELRGPVSDSNEPVHIIHALTNSNHNPKAKNRINLGTAHATHHDSRYYLLLGDLGTEPN